MSGVPTRPRGQRISSEEEELFRTALKDASPLKTRARVTKRVAKAVRVHGPSPHFAPTPVYQEEPAPRIGGHPQAHMRRGRLEPESRIDLHGMTQQRAYSALLGFLSSAHARGQRLVLVITGKGGVLRTSLPFWLGQPDVRIWVAGINEAHVKHGGGGAFYVSLKRRKTSR
jgi:DNA-nicking Smr family endonuclease